MPALTDRAIRLATIEAVGNLTPRLRTPSRVPELDEIKAAFEQGRPFFVDYGAPFEVLIGAGMVRVTPRHDLVRHDSPDHRVRRELHSLQLVQGIARRLDLHVDLASDPRSEPLHG